MRVNAVTDVDSAAEADRAEKNIRKLAVQHVDYGPVYVDDFDGRRSTNTKQTNY